MKIEALVSVVALGISLVLAIVQVLKWKQELKDKHAAALDTATKAEAERDSIVIKGAEGALLMMQGMLDVAKMVEGELRSQIRELELESRKKDERIYQLEQENRSLVQRIEDLERRMTQQEGSV